MSLCTEQDNIQKCYITGAGVQVTSPEQSCSESCYRPVQDSFTTTTKHFSIQILKRKHRKMTYQKDKLRIAAAAAQVRYPVCGFVG